MRTITKALAGAASLALVGVGVPLASAADGAPAQAAVVAITPATRITFEHNAYAPGLFGLDTDGDKVADAFGYCMEPTVSSSKAVLAGTQKLAAYDLSTRTFVKDAGRTRWVVKHGYGSVSRFELAAKAGVALDGQIGGTSDAAMQAATQAAIWRYSAGLVVNPLWRYGNTGAENDVFQKTYAYLTKNAQSIDGAVTVYDEIAGQTKTQAVVVVTPDEPTDEPTKDTGSPEDPTKPVDPSKYL